MENIDRETVEGFADEWSRFDHGESDGADIRTAFDAYFAIFPWERLPANAVGFDAGCGTGRWARRVAPKVGILHCVDAGMRTIEVARKNLASLENVRFHLASIAAMPFEDGSMDFGYSLGVLHHMPDTAAAVEACVRKLKPGAPLLLYLYYAFDNRPAWFRSVWRASELVRRTVSRMPHSMRYAASQAIAAGVYWPLSRSALVLERLGRDVDGFPLSAYRNRSFYMLRTDALDRFGTRLEQRFTRDEMRRMMERAGLRDVVFHEAMPYWCAVGYRA